MPDYSVEQELVQFGEGSLTFLEARMGSNHQAGDILALTGDSWLMPANQNPMNTISARRIPRAPGRK